MISIPLSLAIGLALLDLFGFSINQLSIVGLVVALGLLVDDSIVVVENIARFLRMGYSRKDAAIQATRQIGVAVVGCTATLIFAFLPLMFLPEAAGDFIRSLPAAVVATVLASLFVSLTIVPFLASLLLKEEEDEHGNFFMRGLHKLISGSYRRLLHGAIARPYVRWAWPLPSLRAAWPSCRWWGSACFPSPTSRSSSSPLIRRWARAWPRPTAWPATWSRCSTRRAT
jgi:multidrug efflux pump subunit AcrB